MAYLTELEEQIKELLLDKFNDQARVLYLPTEDDLEYVVDYIVRRPDKRYPYLLIIANAPNEVSADSTKRMGTDNVPFSVYVAVQYDGRDEMLQQRRVAAQWCENVRVALQGRRVNGGSFTSKAAIDGYEQEPVFNLEGMALYRTGFAVTLNIDLDEIAL